MEDFHVAIVGGGITGLAAAYYLQEEATTSGLPITYTLLERSNRWGGKIHTEEVPGDGKQPFVVEGGPDSFITQKPWAFRLSRELGMEERLLPTNDEKRKVYVLNNGRPTPLPDGVLLIVPTKFLPFALSPLISLPGKLRMGMDLFIPPKTDGEDETLAEFITRRLGSEALDKIAEPLMSGIYNAEADRQSLLSTFPRFRAIEEKHGSLIRGMLAARKARAQAANSQPSPNGQQPAAKPPSIFVSYVNGMQELVAELEGRLKGDLRLNTGVERIEESDRGYMLSLEAGGELAADAVILAVPAYAAATLVEGFAADAAGALREIRYVSTGTISLAYREADIEKPLDGHGLVVPQSETRDINAVTWSSTKFDRRAPEGHILLRVFFGGSRSPHMMALDDEEVVARVLAELRKMLEIDAEPLFHRIYRWHRANPQYDVGHLERVATIEAALPSQVYVTGSPYRGIGIPDCVHQAQETVAELVEKVAGKKQVPAGSPGEQR